jgi:HAD superfamily hydrolase (TIGR01549 family)
MSFSQFSTWLFDVDGTLIDSTSAVVECMKKTALEMGGEVTDEVELKASFGKGLMNTLGPWVPEGQVDAAIEQYMRNFHSIVGDNIQLYDGVIEILDTLYKKAIPMGIVTGNKMSEMQGIFQKLEIKDYFGAIICADSIPFQKPSPEPVVEALKLLNRPLEGAVFVGDSEHDIRAGKLAGIKTIAVLGGSSPEARLRAAEPDCVLESITELVGKI